MSIKDLFNNPGAKKIQKSVTSDEMVQNVESQEYVEAKRTEFEQFVPPIDFQVASNFAKFGSAELYYEKSFERIHQYYPYDGTLAEKAEFHNSSSYLDKHVFDNLYPRTNGYVTFNGTSQYITVDGGPHTASAGMIGKALDTTFDSSMIYDEAKKRTSAFEFRGDDGVTIEFWLKVPNTAANRTIMHVTGAASGEIKLQLLSSDTLQVAMGTNSLATQTVNVMTTATNGTNWNHFAVTIQSSSAGLTFKSYKNGQYNSSVVKTGAAYDMSSILPVNDGLKMTIGADKSAANKVTGSLDEFRYWKTTRSAEAIFNTWFIPVGGGTNKYDSNVSLGLYFKFNEGITTDTSLDSIALDYSGRINNGTIVGYATGLRNTGSAIREKLSEPEYLEPIIYSTHPTVVSKKAEYKTSGSLADYENSSMLLSYFPGWMQEEDEQNGKQLKYLSQVIGSYFDTLWHQINFVDKIHDHHYISGSNKALPFAKKLLYDRGFVVPDLFVDATITENLLNKDDNEVYEKQINEVRNTIYHNLYNNLETIYKSKGTEKSFRNFFRSLGIGQDVVKLRMYADDSTFVLRNNYEYKSYERKYLNFNYEGHFDATLYQTSSTGNPNIHIPGDTSHLGSLTFETEIVLPRKNRSNDIGFLPFASLTASVAGFHTSGSGYTHPALDHGMSVYVLKEKLDTALNPDDSHRIRFMLTGAFGELISPYYSYQYENNKWNIAVRLKHENYPYANVTGNVSNNYVVELYGVEADGSTKRNSFHLTTGVASNYFSDNKIFYAGAHRENFTGTSLYNTDIKLGYVRYWHSYLSNEAVDQHAYDSETFGANESFENDLVNTYSVEIPREKTLGFHWSFNNLTTSDASGEMLVSDLSSGSVATNYGVLSNTIERYVQGKAVGFNNNASNALDKLYIQTARKRLPDDLMSSDLTTIKTEEAEQFFVDDDVSDNFYSFEKSMQGVISDEMMNMFSTALDLNNLIGQPNQRYHHRYNLADFLRDRFYDDVENEPDIEKFTSFYKWIDDSISVALQQLTPASARFSEKINNVIESHVLERSKYVHQVPILTTFQSTEGSIKGISEMKYDWKHGHAPFFPEEEQTNVLWQRERKEKSGLREQIRTSRNNHSLQSSGIVKKEIGGSARISDIYATRRFSKTYDLDMVSKPSIHGGVNFSNRKNSTLFHESISPAGGMGTTAGVPQNIITIGVGDGSGLVRKVRDDDNQPVKSEISSRALIGNREGEEYGHNIKGDLVLPLSLMSGTVHSGFNSEVKTNFASDIVLTNLHHDIAGNYNERSIQGPFTEAHIGGLQYRHVDINKYDANKSVAIKTLSGGSFPTGSISFTASVLSTRLSAGTGSSVTIRDGDGTILTALYSNVYDLYDNQWTNMDELVFIINNKLDMTTNKVSNNFLELTQSVTGNFYNYSIQSSSHGFITASGFGGGTGLTYATTYANVDGPENRPEGWGLVFKDHSSQGDSDGSLGFIGADYATPYPSSVKLKATRYREETAKRPVNIKNIKTLTGSQVAGNYSNEIQLFSISSESQRKWLVMASDDDSIDILPPFISTSLPSTTHYQTLIGVSPLDIGNVFGEHQNNRQPDGGIVSPHVPGAFATGSFVVTGSPSVATIAKGSFMVTGSPSAATFSTGSFVITGSPSAPVSPSNASFSIWGIGGVKEASAMVITQSSGAKHKFEVDLNGAVVNGGYTSISGATDTLFWNDMSSSLGSALPGYTVGYTVDPETRSIAISSSAAANSRLKSTTISNGGGGTAGYAISFYLYFHTFGQDTIKTIYEARNVAAGATTKFIYIESGSLKFENVWRDDTGGGDEFVDTFVINNFTSSYNQALTHLSFSHSGTMGQGNQLILYINGVSSSALAVSSLAQNKGSATPGPASYVDLATTGISLFAKEDGTEQLFKPGSTGPIYLDEVVVYPEARNHADMLALYNGGQWQPTKPGGPTMIMDFEKLTIGSGITNGQVIEEGGSNNNNLTASINSTGDLVPLTSSGGSITILKTHSSASFLISNSPAGAEYNLVLNLETPLGSFTNLVTSSGGNGYGASGGMSEGDILIINDGISKRFHLTSSATADSSPNFYIRFTGSSNQIYTALRDKINAKVATTATFVSQSTQAVFSLTSSTAGTAGNMNLTEAGNSFSALDNVDGGLNPGATGGIQDGDYFIYSLGSSPKNFYLTGAAVSDAGSNYYIQTTGSSAQIWTALENRIQTATGITVDVDNQTHQAKFSLTASSAGAAGNKTLGLVDASGGPPTSFSSIVHMAGGTDTGATGGIQNGDKLTYDASGTPKHFVFSYTSQSDAGSNYYIMTTGSSAQIWTALESKVESVTGVTVNVDTSAGHQASFATTASATGSSGNKGLSETGTSITSVLGMLGGIDSIDATYAFPDNVIMRPRADLASSERNINTRFSAPGGPEIQTIGYLDAHSQTYSVHNAMPWRNLSVLGSGSGESAAMRVEDHLGFRRGLRTLRALHMGRHGIDSQYGVVTSTEYPTNGSFNKQHRNTSQRYEYSSGELIITGSSYDNMHINSSIPRSEFQYSWIKHSQDVDSTKRFLGYAPRDGVVSSSAGYVEAIIFQTASTIIGS